MIYTEVKKEIIEDKVFNFCLEKTEHPKGWKVSCNNHWLGWCAGSKKEGQNLLKEIINDYKNL